MPIDPEDVRKHFASLNDEALLLIERDDLTHTAQKILDAEVQRRQLDARSGLEDAVTSDIEDKNHPGQSFKSVISVDIGDAAPLQNTFPITTYNGATPSGTADASDALSALKSAGIPCEIIETRIDPADEPVGTPYTVYQVMVPDVFVLQASAVLDTALHNAEAEEDWRANFEDLSDEELTRLNIEALCAPILDRAARLRKAYEAEVARRSNVRFSSSS